MLLPDAEQDVLSMEGGGWWMLPLASQGAACVLVMLTGERPWVASLMSDLKLFNQAIFFVIENLMCQSGSV